MLNKRKSKKQRRRTVCLFMDRCRKPKGNVWRYKKGLELVVTSGFKAKCTTNSIYTNSKRKWWNGKWICCKARFSEPTHYNCWSDNSWSSKNNLLLQHLMTRIYTNGCKNMPHEYGFVMSYPEAEILDTSLNHGIGDSLVKSRNRNKERGLTIQEYLRVYRKRPRLLAGFLLCVVFGFVKTNWKEFWTTIRTNCHTIYHIRSRHLFPYYELRL